MVRSKLKWIRYKISIIIEMLLYISLLINLLSNSLSFQPCRDALQCTKVCYESHDHSSHNGWLANNEGALYTCDMCYLLTIHYAMDGLCDALHATVHHVHRRWARFPTVATLSLHCPPYLNTPSIFFNLKWVINSLF